MGVTANLLIERGTKCGVATGCDVRLKIRFKIYWAKFISREDGHIFKVLFQLFDLNCCHFDCLLVPRPVDGGVFFLFSCIN